MMGAACMKAHHVSAPSTPRQIPPTNATVVAQSEKQSALPENVAKPEPKQIPSTNATIVAQCENHSAIPEKIATPEPKQVSSTNATVVVQSEKQSTLPETVATAEPSRQHICSMGYATGAAITHFRSLHPEVSLQDAKTLQANLDISYPLYFWQLYSVLGSDRIIGIVRNLYTRIYADTEEPWLPNAFRRISSIEHHIGTQAGFWLDVMGRGRCYHGGEGRLNFHHHHNAGHVMTQVGAARWMHHMRLALDESDLGTDPRVRPTIDKFLQVRMEKYAQQHVFQTGDRVYKAWNSEDWTRTETWRELGPEPKRCPITGQTGECEANTRELIDDQTASTGTGASSRASTPASSQPAP